MLGVKKFSMPPEKKFYESEKIAYVVAVLSAAVLVITGIVKVLAHAIHGLPAGLMHVMFIVHDLSAILVTLFLLAHLFFGVLIPSAWPGLHSMLSGYMSLDVVKKDYPGWYEDLTSADEKNDR
jgi:formate dehydrogenase subunit gamma